MLKPQVNIGLHSRCEEDLIGFDILQVDRKEIKEGKKEGRKSTDASSIRLQCCSHAGAKNVRGVRKHKRQQ